MVNQLLDAPGFGMVRDVANLREPFAPYYAPSADIVAAALRTGIVAPDTNVMLAAYRFERQARDGLFSAFEKLGDRLWVPYQAALEFHRNRLGVIAAQEDCPMTSKIPRCTSLTCEEESILSILDRHDARFARFLRPSKAASVNQDCSGKPLRLA